MDKEEIAEWIRPRITFLAAAPIFLGKASASFAIQLVVTFILIAVFEILFYFIPGLSVSSLLIAMASIKFGFLPAFLVSFFGIELAHFIIRKDIMIALLDLFSLLPMVAFGAFYGTIAIEHFGSFGWPLLGVFMGLIKWGVAIPTGFLFGRNMSKRFREILLEPTINVFIFWKVRLLFAFLF